jgi:lipopolysaccharide biosynthesis regulator YciM
MSNLLALLLLVILAGLIYLLYREYRRSRVMKTPLHTEALMDLLDGRKEAAFAKLKETVNQDSDNVDAYLRLAELLNERGQHDRANRIYQTLALRRNLEKADEQKIQLALAREHVRLNRVNKAISVLEQVSEKDPRDLTSRELLLFIYAQNERWDDVKDLMGNLLKLQKDKHRAALYGAEIGARIYAKEPETAARYFEQALQLDDKLMPALIYAGDVLYGQGKMSEAVEKWKQVLVTRPELGFMVLERLEKAFYESGRYEEVIRVYEELINKVPDDATLYVALARIHAKKGDIERARGILRRLPSDQRDDVLVRLMAADLGLHQGNVEDTRRELAQVESKLAVSRFRCGKCGLVIAGEFAWRCNRCGAWESFAQERKTPSSQS